jgi:hypothetical protein
MHLSLCFNLGSDSILANLDRQHARDRELLNPKSKGASENVEISRDVTEWFAGGRSSLNRLRDRALLFLRPLSSMPFDLHAPDLGASAEENRRGQGEFVLNIVRRDYYDQRRRLLGRQYVADGRAVADFRYEYDGTNRERVRQYLHEGGRADLFGYDKASRLKRADFHARPEIAGETLMGSWPVDQGWLAGDYGRTYNYNAPLDRVETVATDSRPGEQRPIVASTFANYDESGHAGTVDGFTQEINDHGNVTHAQLLSGAATLEYDGLSRLVKVTRLDQSTITYDYRGDGPLVQRTVQCTPAAQGCVSGKRAYIYDGHRLLEEYEIGAQSSTLRSRYYYADEAEVPVAAHFLDPQTNLFVLHFFVVDRVGSVHGVLDEAGNWVERVRYDAWGRPTIELPDPAVPIIHEIKVEDITRDILVVFTEPVLPAADAQSAPAIASALEGLTGVFELHEGTNTIPVTITYDEMNPNYARGTVLRLAIDPVDRPADGTSVELDVMGNRLFDRWSNAAGSGQFEIDYEEGYSYPGANQGSTAPQTISESRVGNVLFFQSHFYDDPFVPTMLRHPS